MSGMASWGSEFGADGLALGGRAISRSDLGVVLEYEERVKPQMVIDRVMAVRVLVVVIRVAESHPDLGRDIAPE